MKSNPIRELLRSRIRTLVENARAAGELKHKPSIGSLRETYLRDFFRDIVPPAYRVASGFVLDADGATTPQLDFIVYDPSELPAVILSHDLAVLPVESVVLAAEIKSVLTTKDFEQLKSQRVAINALKYAADDDSGAMRVPHVIFALESQVAMATLCNWLHECTDLMSVCVIGQYIVERVPSGPQTWVSEPGTYDETLATMFKLYNGVLDVTAMREKMKFRFQDYMVPEEPPVAPKGCPEPRTVD